MKSELKIDKAIYLVDRQRKEYYFLKRNLNWRNLDKNQNERNKKSINGFTRIFRNSSRRKFIYKVK